MVKEQYVSYKVAKLLHEKGFEINPELDYWKIGPDGTMYFICSIGAYTSDCDNKTAYYRPKDSYPCPTQQMAMRWLREEKNIHINVYTFNRELPISGNTSYTVDVATEKDSPMRGHLRGVWETYEKAAEAGIRFALEHELH